MSAGNEQAVIARLAAQLAVQRAENRWLAEQLAAVEGSTAWAVARRLSRLRRRLAPDGSRRQTWMRRCLRGARTTANNPISSPPAAVGMDLFGPPLASRLRHFRVAFVGSAAACEAASMRYRAHNLVEALAEEGHRSLFVPREEAPSRLAEILGHDLIVLVRLRLDEVPAGLVESARRLGRPLVYDIDDYLFDPWVLPYVEAFRAVRPCDALRTLDERGACLDLCDAFTGSTPYLAERAAARGKKSYAIPNGVNAEQMRLSSLALAGRNARPEDGITRLGYFSGTRTHQADFRVAYPALMRLLGENPAVRLVVVGDLDLGDFPGLLPLEGQVERLPLRPWRELPAAVAGVDVNLIPLELTPFNEGKSNLKYFEAGLVEVPSVASPTRVLRDGIRHGHNGLLAETPDEWYACLRELVADPARRRELGASARRHVLQHHTPAATAREALAAYRDILARHRAAPLY